MLFKVCYFVLKSSFGQNEPFKVCNEEAAFGFFIHNHMIKCSSYEEAYTAEIKDTIFPTMSISQQRLFV